MGRSPGSRNRDFQNSRAEILDRIFMNLFLNNDLNISMRHLSRVAKVSIPTLTHYFPTQEDMILAIFQKIREEGAPHLAMIAEGPATDLRKATREMAESFVEGWKIGVNAIHQLGLQLGISNEKVGPLYINEILEPALQAIELRFQKLQKAGQLPKGDTRVVALEFLSPLFLALLHQDSLGGKKCRPLKIDDFLKQHLRFFLGAQERT